MKLKVDINCDLGESFGNYRVGYDAQVMPHITSANIACGFHAGDSNVMAHTVDIARRCKVAIGAHPGFPDLQGFGRREMQLSEKEVRNLVIHQIGALQAFAKTAGQQLQHVKLHGALYNMAMKDASLAKAAANGIAAFDPKLIVFAQNKSELAKAAANAHMRVAFEVFADRGYCSDGSLVPRATKGSVFEEPKTVTNRAVEMVKEQRVTATDGGIARLGEIHTICVHGDNPRAVALAGALRRGLEKAGITVVAVGTFI